MTAALRTAALLAAGVVTAVAAVVLHTRAWGLLLAVVAVGATLLALPAGWSTRLPFGMGFALAVGRLAMRRGEGDYLVPGDAAGYVVLGLAVVVAAVALATLPRPARGQAPGSSGADIYTDRR